LHPPGCFIGVSGGGGWGWDPCSRRRCSFGTDVILLAYLLFFLIRVAEDDDFVITGWPEDVAVEVTEEPYGELLITWSIRDETFLVEDEERSTTRAFPGGLPCSNIREQWQCEETSCRDCNDGGDPDDADGGVEALLGGEDPSIEGERECLVPLLSSIASKRRREETQSKKWRSVR
jgi:hypothetical protein